MALRDFPWNLLYLVVASWAAIVQNHTGFCVEPRRYQAERSRRLMEVPDYNPQLLIDKIHVIHRAGQRLHELLTPESLAQEIISVLEDVVTYEFGAVLLIEHGSGHLVPFAL